MERNFKIKIEFVVTAEGDDDESLQDAVKAALKQAIEADESDEAELEFYAEEIEES